MSVRCVSGKTDESVRSVWGPSLPKNVYSASFLGARRPEDNLVEHSRQESPHLGLPAQRNVRRVFDLLRGPSSNRDTGRKPWRPMLA